MDTQTTRESIILQFNTDLDRVRSMNLPNPRPVTELTEAQVQASAGQIIEAGLFDRSGNSSGVLESLYRAMLEKVTTTVLI